MHFFVTYEGKRFTTPKTVVADNSAPADIVAALPADVAAQFGPASIDFKEDLFFAKLDWEPTDSDRFALSFKVRDETSAGDQTGTGVAPSAAIDTSNDEKRAELSWSRSGNGWLNELSLTWEDAFFTPRVNGSEQNGAVYTFNPPADSRIIAVNGSDPRAGQNKGQEGWSIGNTITFTDLQWMGGEHTVKAGIRYKSVDLTAQDAVVNNPVFYYDVTAAGTAATPYRTLFGLPIPGFDSVATTEDEQLGVFVQDDWTVNDHLTLNLGLRWDIEWNSSYLDFETPQFLLDAFNTEVAPGVTYAQSLALSSDPNTAYDIDDYISTGGNRKAQDGAFAPRVGFSYDLFGDQQHVIFGGAGRAYDRTLYDYLQLEQTKFALAQAEVRFNVPDHPCAVNGSSCVNFDPAYTQDIATLQALLNGMAGEVNLINNDLEVPYSDQFSLGMRNGVGDWNTSVAVSYIESKDGFIFTLGHRRPDGSFWANRSQPWDFRPPGLSGNMLIGDNGTVTRSTQVLLSAEKPFTQESRWGATFAYTWTDASQNRDINEHYSFDQVSIQEYPFILSNAAPKHRLVGTGSWAGPWGLTFAGKLTLSTPTPRNLISCYPAPAVFANGAPCTAIGYTAESTIGYQSLDLQITKDFEIRDVAALYLRLDALNVTNEHNLVDFTDTTGANGLVNGGDYNPIGNITGVPRTLRMSFGVKF